MALTDGNGSEMVMPVAPLGNSGGGFGNAFGGDWAWIILLLLLVGGNGWGNGWGGNNLATDSMAMYPWMNQASITTNGFQNQALGNQINDIQSGIYGINTQLCNGFSGVNATINSGFANAETAANNRQMANMQTAFNSQTAITQGMNTIASGLQNCCCENRANIADLKYTVATENCADRAVVSDGIRDIIASQTASTQRILDQLCADKIEQKNDVIAQLRSELLYARGQASQDVQTAAIQAGQRNLANEVEQYVAPRAIPAYYVQNPNCCGNYSTCGCGCA